MLFELRGSCKTNDLFRRITNFLRELSCQEDRCFRDAKISRPFLRFVDATQERRIFFGREISVELCAKFGIHPVRTDLRAVPKYFCGLPLVRASEIDWGRPG